MSRGDHESSSSLSTELPVGGGGDQTTTATSNNHTEENVKPTVTMHNDDINEKDELVTVTPTTDTAAISTDINVATTTINKNKGDTMEVNEMTDTTENTTASSNSPTNIDTTTGTTATTNSKNSPTNQAQRKNGKISFGTVHVREHRMTLGSNPEVQHGVPVELSWVKQQSFLYDTIDEFEQSKDPVGTSAAQQQQGSDTENESSSELLASVPVIVPNTVRRIPAAERAEIAQLYHSRESILRITQEVQTIQESRNHSRTDKAAQKVIVQLHKQPHSTITSNKVTADDVLLAHLDKKKQEAASSPKNKRNQQDLIIKKKKKWWFLC